MKASQLDPLDIPDYYPKSNKLFKLELTQGKLFGLSSIKRIGPILVGFESDAVHMLLNLGVTDLKGNWRFWLEGKFQEIYYVGRLYKEAFWTQIF